LIDEKLKSKLSNKILKNIISVESNLKILENLENPSNFKLPNTT
jgi:hypothetical protein